MHPVGRESLPDATSRPRVFVGKGLPTYELKQFTRAEGATTSAKPVLPYERDENALMRHREPFYEKGQGHTVVASSVRYRNSESADAAGDIAFGQGMTRMGKDLGRFPHFNQSSQMEKSDALRNPRGLL
jgi:hypothetical protein